MDASILNSLLEAVTFNGGDYSRTETSNGYSVLTVNAPVGRFAGKTPIRSGTVPLHVYTNRSISDVLAIRFRPKVYSKSEIYRGFLEWLEDSIADKNPNKREMIKVKNGD